MLIFRQVPRNAPGVSSVATGAATRPNLRRELPALPLGGLPRRLDRVLCLVTGNPGRQHPQGNPVAQPPRHVPSLRHDQRSCTQTRHHKKISAIIEISR
jgi:hypothetical protein